MNHFEFFKSHGLKASTSDGRELQIQGFSSLQGNKRDFIIQYAQRHKPGILLELLWTKAWALADWVDNPDGAPIEERKLKVPEIERLSRRINKLMEQKRNF